MVYSLHSTVYRPCSTGVQIFAFNLAAPFIAQFFNGPLFDILPYSDFVFGNETEALAVSEAAKYGVRSAPGLRCGLCRVAAD